MASRRAFLCTLALAGSLLLPSTVSAKPAEQQHNARSGNDRAAGYPSAKAASRSDVGTSRIISSVVRVTSGIIMAPKAMPPAVAEK